MKKTNFLLLGIALIMGISCVGKKVYTAERIARNAAEAREKVLVQELLDRKKESADLIKKVGDLNKTIGNQEAEIKDLEAELVARTQSMGASSSKLSSEKAALEKQLATTNELLEQKSDALSRVKNVQQKRASILAELESGLKKAFEAFPGLTITIQHETVLATVPDRLLFEPSGMTIGSSGRAVLGALAEYLAARPDLDVEIIAYTDNVLPAKEKSLKDTWDWSLQRATTAVRILSKELNANANQLTPVGRGEFYPLASNETPEGRAQNRRTEWVFRPVLPTIPQED